MTIITLLFLLLLLAGYLNGLMDMLQFKYEQSIFADLKKPQFWNPAVSWKNKYKDYDQGDTRAKFPFSKNVLVFLTDGWHLLKEGMLSSIAIAITILLPDWELGWGFLNGIAQFLALRAVFFIGFYMSYKTKFTKKIKS